MGNTQIREKEQRRQLEKKEIEEQLRSQAKLDKERQEIREKQENLKKLQELQEIHETLQDETKLKIKLNDLRQELMERKNHRPFEDQIEDATMTNSALVQKYYHYDIVMQECVRQHFFRNDYNVVIEATWIYTHQLPFNVLESEEGSITADTRFITLGLVKGVYEYEKVDTILLFNGPQLVTDMKKVISFVKTEYEKTKNIWVQITLHGSYKMNIGGPTHRESRVKMPGIKILDFLALFDSVEKEIALCQDIVTKNPVCNSDKNTLIQEFL